MKLAGCFNGTTSYMSKDQGKFDYYAMIVFSSLLWRISEWNCF